MSRPSSLFILGLALYTLSMRLMPFLLSHFGVAIDPANSFYPWNFSPMTAFCLFGAAYYTHKQWAFLLPMGIWFASDFVISALIGQGEWAFHNSMITVYSSYVLIVLLGLALREKRTLPAVWLTGLAGETLFFLITNFGTWYFFPTYSKDLGGLMLCYTAALPFFSRALISTALFTTLIFSPFLLKERKPLAVPSETPTITA